MTRTTSDLGTATDAQRAGEATARRVDAAHEVRSESANVPPSFPADEPLGAPSSSDLSFDAAAQVQHQAGQLAAHLVARQRELDHREAGWHARLAQWEHEQSIARLAHDERETAAQARDEELNTRAAALDARERALRQREIEFRSTQVESEFFLQRQEDELELREAQVKLVEERLANEQRLVKQASAELRRARERFRQASRRIAQRQEQRRIEWEQMSRGVLAALERRRAGLVQATRGDAAAADDAAPTPGEETEQLRAALRMELLAVRRMLDEREAEAAEWAHAQAAFLAEQQAEQERLAAREGELAIFSAELDARRESLDRAERQRNGSHGQIQLADSSPAVRQELEAFRIQIAEECARLVEQQAQFAHWAKSRESELKAQAVALAKRKESLDSRARQLGKQEVDVRLERLRRAAKGK